MISNILAMIYSQTPPLFHTVGSQDQSLLWILFLNRKSRLNSIKRFGLNVFEIVQYAK
jgi:hypothetical protein